MSLLTEADAQLLPLAWRENGGYHVATDWYLHGWKPLPYQYAVHQATQLSTTLLAGIAAGKTRGLAASGLIDCLSIPYFRLLYTSVTAKQAELPFDMWEDWRNGNERIGHLIEDIKLRPWPIVKFKNFSEAEFRTAGTDARFIRGSEFDRIVFGEAGLDYPGEIVKVLRGRLRGTRPDGTTRLARLDVETSPTDALWLQERYYRGIKSSDKYDPGYISFKVRTRDNTYLTTAQIEAMLSEYTDEMVVVEMDAEFPDYGLSMFPKSHISACTSQVLNDLVYTALNPALIEAKGPPKKGYVIEEHPRHGVTKYEVAYEPKASYIMAGDPGMDDPPKRNAGCVMVFRADTMPRQMVYFDWIFGHGSYNPFLNSYKYAINKYRPLIKVLDTTGPQRAMQELAFENAGIETDGINFTRDKDGAINALSLAITQHELVWPIIKGLNRQLSTYTRASDSDKDFPNDITMTMAMSAFALRNIPLNNDPGALPVPTHAGRQRRTNRRRRR